MSTLLALIGYNVDVVCYSYYLSERDKNDFWEFFKIFDIQNKISYGTFTEISEKMINKHGDLRKLSSNLLNGVENTCQNIKLENTILLIDEVDVFFSTQFYGQTYNPSTLIKTQDVRWIINYIWKEKHRLNNSSLFNEIINQTQAFKSLTTQFPGFESFFKGHIFQMISSASVINQTFSDKNAHLYEVIDNKIGYKIFDQISFTTHYGYLTIFAYYKEFELGKITWAKIEEISGINLSCGHYSYAQVPFKYSKILGCTGTLESLHENSQQILKKYVQQQCLIPSMFGESKLCFDKTKNVFVEKDQDNQFLKINKEAQRILHQKRPILIFFKDKASLEKYEKSNQLPIKKEDLLILNQEKPNIDVIIQKSTRQSQVVLVDREFGRGTDFICNNKSIDNEGGLVVIQSFLSKDYSEEVQIKGRTARQSKNGEYLLILNAQDLQEDFHVKIEDIKIKAESISTFYNYINDIRKNIWGQEVSKVEDSIKKAQEKHKLTLQYMEQLYKGNKQQAIQHLQGFNNTECQKSTNGYHFILCLDESGSMASSFESNTTKWQQLTNSVEQFVYQREQITYGNQIDTVSIIYYSSLSRIIMKYQQIKDILPCMAKNTPCFQNTVFKNAIYDVIQILQEENYKQQQLNKVILFLSDGGDNDYDSTQLFEYLSKIKGYYGNKIQGWQNVGFGKSADSSILIRMTDFMKECGGTYSNAINSMELDDVFQKLADFHKYEVR